MTEACYKDLEQEFGPVVRTMSFVEAMEKYGDKAILIVEHHSKGMTCLQ